MFPSIFRTNFCGLLLKEPYIIISCYSKVLLYNIIVVDCFCQVLRRKFDGHSFTDSVSKQAHVRRRYRITRLPRFLVLQLVRFTKNNFALEKNPTIVSRNECTYLWGGGLELTRILHSDNFPGEESGDEGLSISAFGRRSGRG